MIRIALITPTNYSSRKQTAIARGWGFVIPRLGQPGHRANALVGLVRIELSFEIRSARFGVGIRQVATDTAAYFCATFACVLPITWAVVCHTPRVRTTRKRALPLCICS